jgi:SAM-dependent methyltransferase
MTDQPDQIPGTAAYYEKHIYVNLPETIGLGLDDTPSSAVAWAERLGLMPNDSQCQMLEIGCGAGRNLNELRQVFPKAKLYGFDGSPTALRMARAGLPEVTLALGDIYGTWPFKQQFDIVWDITAGIPEAASRSALDKYASSLRAAVKAGGHVVVEAITPNDESSKRFGRGHVVNWVSGSDIKRERLMSLADARHLFERHAFKVVDSQLVKFEAVAFVETVQREFLQLALRAS